MGNDGATYEQVVDKDGNPVTDPSGNPVVIAPKGTDASGNEQEDATQSLTIPYLPRPAKRLKSPGYPCGHSERLGDEIQRSRSNFRKQRGNAPDLYYG